MITRLVNFTNDQILAGDKRYLTLAIIVGAALRVFTLARKSLWLDEVVTLQVASMNVEDIIIRNIVQWEPHPPFYYLLMHYWLQLGSDEMILRLPSAFAGILAIPLMYGWLYQWFGRSSAIVAAWFLALAPLHIWYSQEARMYALVCTLGLASTFFYSLGILRGNTLYWIAWLIVTVLGLYTDYSMLLLVLLQLAVFVSLLRRIIKNRKVHIGIPWVAWPLTFVLFLPQVSPLVFQVKQIGRGGGGYLVSLQKIFLGWGLEITPEQWYIGVVLIVLISLVILFVIVWLLISRWNRVYHQRVILPIGAVVLYLLILVAAAVLQGLVLKRQTLILFPYILSGIAVAFSISSRRLYLLIGLILLTLPFTGYTVAIQEQEDWRGTARLLEQQATPQDIILVNASYMQLPLNYYYRGLVPHYGIGPEDVPSELTRLLSGHKRVWLILSSEIYTDPQGLVQHWLDQHLILLKVYAWEKIRVRLYQIQD